VTDGESRVLARIEARREASLAEIRAAIRQPSVSRTGEGLSAMADQVEAALRDLGARAWQSPGAVAPIVEGVLTAGAGLPTLLVYELYDVQPAAHQPGWSVPPFDAVVLTDPAGRQRLVGRGAFNSKGPLFGLLATLHAFAEAGVALPCNLRFLIEGEEEIGSPGLAAHIVRHRDELAACDAAFIPYFGTDAAGATILRLGFKGLVLLEFRVTGGDWGGPARGDVHALHGAEVDSPSWRLVHALASLTDASGRLMVDGLEALVPPSEAADRALIEAVAPRHDLDAYARGIGVARLRPLGDAAAHLRELMFTCTLNIDALQAGRIEEGDAAATLIPRTARALVDLRVVPGVAPEAAVALVREHLRRHGFPEVEVLVRSAYPASRARPAEPVVRALTAACAAEAADLRVFPIHAGAAPMHVFPDLIGIPYGFGGVGHGGLAHAADEYILVDDITTFMRSMARLLFRFGDFARCSPT
jgi:acetylornithine deacetylase/succinyl-diaminopimelate desuccinylase-like protein